MCQKYALALVKFRIYVSRIWIKKRPTALTTAAVKMQKSRSAGWDAEGAADTNFPANLNISPGRQEKHTMPKLNEIFSGNFLKAEDLKGASPRVTISQVEVKEFDDGNKLVIHFQGKDKCLVVNKTNANIIAENTGSQDTDDWVGRTIQLAVKKVEFQGKLVPAIRVVLEDAAPPTLPRRAPAPQPAPAPQSVSDNDGGPVGDDDVGF